MTGVGLDRHLSVTVNAPSSLLISTVDDAKGQINFEVKETGIYQFTAAVIYTYFFFLLRHWWSFYHLCFTPIPEYQLDIIHKSLSMPQPHNPPKRNKSFWKAMVTITEYLLYWTERLVFTPLTTYCRHRYFLTPQVQVQLTKSINSKTVSSVASSHHTQYIFLTLSWHWVGHWRLLLPRAPFHANISCMLHDFLPLKQ